MRVRKRMVVRRWCECVLRGVLVLLGLATVGLPDSHAQMSYSGGFVQRHRRPAYFPPEPALPKTPAQPPSYFPDNDSSYSLYYPGEEPERPLPFGIAAAALPWNQAGFVDYNEPPQAPRNASISESKKYALDVTTLPQAFPAAQPATAVIIAHLPEQAAFWVEGTRTRSTGRTRYFQSPPLLRGRKYAYRVRALWLENGQLVSQTRMVPVQAGLIQALYLRPMPAPQAKTKPVAPTLPPISAMKARKE